VNARKKRDNPWYDKKNGILKKTVRNRKEGCDIYVWVTSDLTTIVMDAASRDEEGGRDEMSWNRRESMALDNKKIGALAFWLNMSRRDLVGEMKSMKSAMRAILKERVKHDKEKERTNQRVKDLVQGQ
jgi:hypothetical protein